MHRVCCRFLTAALICGGVFALNDTVLFPNTTSPSTKLSLSSSTTFSSSSSLVATSTISSPRRIVSASSTTLGDNESSIQYAANSTTSITPDVSKGTMFPTQLGPFSVTASAVLPSPSSNASQTFNFTLSLPLNASQSTLNNTDPGFAAQACNAASQLWSSQNSYTTVGPSTYAGLSTTYITPSNATPYTTLCDGFPRAHGVATLETFSYTSIYTDFNDTTTLYSTNIPPPNCTIAPDQCNSMYSSWYAGGFSGLPPACVSPTSVCTAATTVTLGGPDLPLCSFVGGHVQLAFWPVSVRGDLCGNRTTITPNVSMPLVATAFGTVVTSPTVLVSFDSVYATDQCGSPVGSTLTNFVLPQQPAQLSSQCGGYHPGLDGGTQINFADLMAPYQASQYMCMPECVQRGGAGQDYCSTMYDYLNPNIAFPTALTGVMPQWQSCGAGFLGNAVWDPPSALQPVQVVATATVPGGGAPTISAAPASTVTAVPDNTKATSSTVQPAPASIPAEPIPASTSAGGSEPTPASSAPSSDGVAPNLANTTPAADLSSPSTAEGSAEGASQDVESTSKVDVGAIIVSVLAGTSSDDSGDAPSAALTPTTNIASANTPKVIAPIATVGSQTIIADPSGSGGVVIGGSQTLQPGQNTVINSTPISVGTSQIVVGSDSSTAIFSPIPSSTADPVDPATIVSGAIITAGSQTITAVSSDGGVAIGGTTLAPGQQTVINGQTVSNAGSGLAVGSSAVGFSAITVDPATPASVAIVSVDGTPVTALASSGTIVVDGQILTPGQVATINGHTISDAATGVIIDGSTAAFSQIGAQATANDPSITGAVFSVGSQTITAVESGGKAVFNGNTLTSGQVALLNGHTIRDAASALVVDGNTIPFSQLAFPTSSRALVTLGSQTLSAIETGGTVVLDGQTLTPGQVATIGGHIVSDASTGLVVDGTPVPFLQLDGAIKASASVFSGAIIMLGSHSFTAIEASGTVVYDGQTLTPGEQTVINGHTISDASTALVEDGTTYPFSQITPAPVSQVVLTAGSELITASELPDGDFLLDGTTLSPGGAALTFDGQVISDDGSGLVLGGSVTLSPSVAVPSTPGSASRPTSSKAAAVPLLGPSSETSTLALVLGMVCFLLGMVVL